MPDDPPLPRVTLDTARGAVEVELDTVRAPVTAANFLRYVDQGLYRSASFYRVVKPGEGPNPVPISAVQGGLHRTDGVAPLGPIAHESTDQTGLRHRASTVSMARMEVGTADSEFFVVLDDAPALDAGGARQQDGQGFAAFGRVVAGLDILRGLQSLDQMPGSPLPGEVIHPVAFAARRTPTR